MTHHVLLFLPSQIHHPHILPVLGTNIQYESRIVGETVVPVMVVPWCVNGSIAEYVSAGGDGVNRLRLVHATLQLFQMSAEMIYNRQLRSPARWLIFIPKALLIAL